VHFKYIEMNALFHSAIVMSFALLSTIGSRLSWRKLFFFLFSLHSHFKVSFHSAIDFCYSDPCQNGGKCVSLLSDFQCDCTPEWEGKECESGLYLLGMLPHLCYTWRLRHANIIIASSINLLAFYHGCRSLIGYAIHYLFCDI